jgi:hypothetical protein
MYQMQFSCDNTTWSTGEAYTTTRAFNLTNNTGSGCTSSIGTKSIYVKYSDLAGNLSTATTSSIFYTNATTTLTTGTDPATVTIVPGGLATMVDAFTFQTSTGVDIVPSVVVAMDNASSTSLLEITNDTGTLVYGSVANPTGATITVTLSTNTLTASTTLMQYKIRITPKGVTSLPAGDLGVLYPITAKINSWTSTNNKTGTDTGSTTVTINNLAPTVQGDVANVWTSRASAADNDWNAISYGNGLFVAVSGNGTGNRVMTSNDGITWTSRTSAADLAWRGVAYGNNTFVAVAPSLFGQGVMTSPDGINWTSALASTDNSWSSITFGNGIFVAVANSGTGNRVMTSPDGLTWTTRASAEDNDWTSVTFGNNTFVAVSSSGTGNRVMTSSDGITWTLRTTPADNAWASVTYGNNTFVAVASSGTGNRVMTSSDGINWTSRSSAADNSWTSVASTNGIFVAVANSGAGNRIMASQDNGATWSLRTSPSDNSWKAVTYGNNSFVAVANYFVPNLVMTSSKEAPILAPGNAVAVVSYITSADTSVTGLLILRSTSAITDIPANGTAYSLGNTIGASTVACIDTTITPSTADSCTVTGLTNGVVYYYKIFAKNALNSYSSGIVPIGSLATSNNPSTIDQSAYQIFASSTSYTPGTSLAAQNTLATLTNYGDAFRIRTLFQIASTTLGVSGKTMKLQYAIKSGTCDTAFSGEVYRDITTISPISFYDVPALTSGSILGAQVDVTHNADTIVNQSFVDTPNVFTNAQSSLSVGQDAKFDFSLYDNGATSNTSYCIRAVGADGIPLTTYSSIPEIKTAYQRVELDSYRFRNDDGNESSASYSQLENTPIASSFIAGDKVRLRIAISNQAASVSRKAYQLEYAQGACTSWTPVPRLVDTTNQAWRIEPSRTVADNTLTTHSTYISAPNGKTFTQGRLQAFNSASYPVTLGSNEYTELEYSLRSTGSITPYIPYCFRVTNVGDFSDFTYLITPQITVIPATYRHQSGGGGGGGIQAASASAVEAPSAIATTTATTGGAASSSEATSSVEQVAPPAAQQSTTTPTRRRGGGGNVGLLPNTNTFAVTQPQGLVLGDEATAMCVDMQSRMLFGSNDTMTRGEVSQLQYFLKIQGYFNGAITGNYYSVTTNAVKAFQKDNGLIVTGIVGKVTRGKMKEIGCGKYAARLKDFLTF